MCEGYTVPETDYTAIIRNYRHSPPAMIHNGSSPWSQQPGNSFHPEPVKALPAYFCKTVSCCHVRGINFLILNFTPQPLYPPVKDTRYTSNKKLGWQRSRSGPDTEDKISCPPLGLEARTFQSCSMWLQQLRYSGPKFTELHRP